MTLKDATIFNKFFHLIGLLVYFEPSMARIHFMLSKVETHLTLVIKWREEKVSNYTPFLLHPVGPSIFVGSTQR